MLIGLLKNNHDYSVKKWEIACNNININYLVIDITKDDWLSQIKESSCDFFLTRPPGKNEIFKSLYDERLYILSEILNMKTFPKFKECYIYENKKLLSYFLKSKGIPHPQTHTFYYKSDALDYIEKTPLPIVAKTSIGGSGSGVKILKTKKSAFKYVDQAFSSKGVKRRFGPNRVTGKPKDWLTKAISSPEYFWKKLSEYKSIWNDGQKGFLIFQEHIPHSFEWRAVRIGDSYFAHKKTMAGEKASGSKGIEYVTPPKSLLDFLYEICKQNDFASVAIDVFETRDGKYLVNEIQTFFGNVQNCLMQVNGVSGRYVRKNNEWIFEIGDFNKNESYDLRLRTAISLYENNLL